MQQRTTNLNYFINQHLKRVRIMYIEFDEVEFQKLLDNLDLAIKNKDEDKKEDALEEIRDYKISLNDDNEIIKYLVDYNDFFSGICHCSIEAFKLCADMLTLENDPSANLGDQVDPLYIATQQAYSFEDIKAIIEAGMYQEIRAVNIAHLLEDVTSSATNKNYKIIKFLLNYDDSIINDEVYDYCNNNKYSNWYLLDAVNDLIENCDDEELKTIYKKIKTLFLEHGARTRKEVEEFEERLHYVRNIISKSRILIKSIKGEKNYFDLNEKGKLEFLKDISNYANELYISIRNTKIQKNYEDYINRIMSLSKTLMYLSEKTDIDATKLEFLEDIDTCANKLLVIICVNK